MERSFSPRIRLIRAVTRLPVSSALILAATFLYVLTQYLELFEPEMLVRSGFPGASTVLQIKMFPEIYGHFDVWRGAVWRLLFNVFHHGGVMHLVMNSLSLWILGDLLEPRLGRLKYLVFFLTAGYLSVLAQSLIGDNAIGMSGAIYAVFGYLVRLRKFDHEVSQRMSPMLVRMGFGCLILFVPLTAAGLIPVANLAHFAGLGYGWTLARLQCQTRLSRRKTLAGMVGLYAVIAGLTFAAIFPLWNGRYLAWRAWLLVPRNENADRTEELHYWQQASARSPGIAVAWHGQAEILHQVGQKQKAWRIALKGLKLNRSDEKLTEFIRMLWQELQGDSRTREIALNEVRQIFEQETDAWIRRLSLHPPRPAGRPLDIAELLSLLKEQAAEQPRLDALLDVPEDVAGITSPHPPVHEPGEVNPDSPDSAMLGETL